MRHIFADVALSPGDAEQGQMGSNMFADVFMPQGVSPDETSSRIDRKRSMIDAI